MSLAQNGQSIPEKQVFMSMNLPVSSKWEVLTSSFMNKIVKRYKGPSGTLFRITSHTHTREILLYTLLKRSHTHYWNARIELICCGERSQEYEFERCESPFMLNRGGTSSDSSIPRYQHVFPCFKWSSWMISALNHRTYLLLGKKSGVWIWKMSEPLFILNRGGTVSDSSILSCQDVIYML